MAKKKTVIKAKKKDWKTRMSTKDNITKFPQGTPPMVERWDLLATSMTDAAAIQTALEEGYEPFSVTNQMKKVETPAIATPGQPPAGGMTMDTVIWMKRKVLVPMLPPVPEKSSPTESA